MYCALDCDARWSLLWAACTNRGAQVESIQYNQMAQGEKEGKAEGRP